MEEEPEYPRKRESEGRRGSPLEVFRREDREEYQDLVSRFEGGSTVAYSSVANLNRRCGIYLKHKFIPGRNRYADGDWLVATELARLEQMGVYYSSQGRRRYVSQKARAEWLERARRIARRVA